MPIAAVETIEFLRNQAHVPVIAAAANLAGAFAAKSFHYPLVSTAREVADVGARMAKANAMQLPLQSLPATFIQTATPAVAAAVFEAEDQAGRLAVLRAQLPEVLRALAPAHLASPSHDVVQIAAGRSSQTYNLLFDATRLDATVHQAIPEQEWRDLLVAALDVRIAEGPQLNNGAALCAYCQVVNGAGASELLGSSERLNFYRDWAEGAQQEWYLHIGATAESTPGNVVPTISISAPPGGTTAVLPYAEALAGESPSRTRPIALDNQDSRIIGVFIAETVLRRAGRVTDQTPMVTAGNAQVSETAVAAGEEMLRFLRPLIGAAAREAMARGNTDTADVPFSLALPGRQNEIEAMASSIERAAQASRQQAALPGPG